MIIDDETAHQANDEGNDEHENRFHLRSFVPRYVFLGFPRFLDQAVDKTAVGIGRDRIRLDID